MTMMKMEMKIMTTSNDTKVMIVIIIIKIIPACGLLRPDCLWPAHRLGSRRTWLWQGTPCYLLFVYLYLLIVFCNLFIPFFVARAPSATRSWPSTASPTSPLEIFLGRRSPLALSAVSRIFHFFAVLGTLGIDFFGILSISPSSLGWMESQLLTTI